MTKLINTGRIYISSILICLISCKSGPKGFEEKVMKSSESQYKLKKPDPNNDLKQKNLQKKSVDTTANFIRSFLYWYKSHKQNMNTSYLVPEWSDTLNNVYHVDQDSLRKYILYIKKCKYFTNRFSYSLREYIKRMGDSMTSVGQTDGYPLGLDYDLILQTQESKEILSSIENLKISTIDSVGKTISVQLEYYSYERRFLLLNVFDSLKIDSIYIFK